MTDPLEATPGDFLVCGACHRNFKLSSMQDFIQHKLFDCQGIPQKDMECQSCPNKFRTPWSLLQHAQNTHSLKIFLQQGPYSPGIAGVHIDKRSTEKSDDISMQISSSHIDATQEPTKAPADIQVLDRSRGKPVKAVHTPPALPTHTVTVVRSASGAKTAPGPKTSCKCTMLAHSTVTGTSNATTASVAKCNLQCGCIVTRSHLGTPPPVTAPPVQVPASNVDKEPVPPTTAGTDLLLHSLSNLVQGADKAQAISTGPGKHSISVLQPIKLPPGAIIGTAVAIGNPALTRMPFTTVPVGVPTQLKPSFTVLKEINTVQEAMCVNRDNNPNSQGLITPVVASHLMTTPVISKLAESQVVSAKDDTKGLDRSHHQLKPVSRTLILHSPATASNSALVLQKSQISGFVSSPKSIQTNSTSKVNSSVSTKIQEQEDLSPKQPQTCECLCCKVGTCCVRGQPVTSKIDNVIPSGLNVAQNSERSEVQQIRIHCASVQADHTECPDKTEGERKRNKNLKISENMEDADGTDKNSDDAITCCDNQDCGVTIMPGTHEGLKKCCNAVVPKKRKRHMETKHRIKKRVTAPSFSMPEENTIYIDFQPGSDIPRVSSATGDPLGTITVNTTSANSQQMMQTIDNQRSLTLSFPVSYTRKASCSPGNCSRMGQGQECTCGCCPLKFQSSRDKKSKSARRLSSSSNDSKKELTTVRATAGSAATGQTNNDLAIGVKDESMMSTVDSSEEASQSSISGTRKISRLLGRAGVGKKRRYPTSRPFKCDKCDHAFNQRIHLKKHQSKHTGVKPFKCEQCDYSTVERSHLKVHIRVHTGEKPYKCSHCEYATAQNSTLKIHLKRHHGQCAEDGSSGSLSCDVCGREFDDEGPFLQHQQEHPPQANSSVSNSAGVSSAEQHGVTEPEPAVQVHSGDEEALPDGRLIIKEM